MDIRSASPATTTGMQARPRRPVTCGQPRSSSACAAATGCAMVWRRYVDRVARGLALIVNTLDPDIFVMGGGMSNVEELYADLPPALARQAFSPYSTHHRRARHGDSSGVRGAAWLWKDHERSTTPATRAARASDPCAGSSPANYFARLAARVHSKAAGRRHRGRLEVELMLERELAERFPDDAFLGEETGAAELGAARGIWVVDPIDGTQPFVSGMMTWCVSLAYVRDDVVEFGFVSNPPLGELFEGGRGRPAPFNGRRSRRIAAPRSPTGSSPSATRPASAPTTSCRFRRLLGAAACLSATAPGRSASATSRAGACSGTSSRTSTRGMPGRARVMQAAGGRANDYLTGDALLSGNRIVAGAPGCTRPSRRSSVLAHGAAPFVLNLR